MPKFEIPDSLWEIQIDNTYSQTRDPNYGNRLEIWDVRLNFCDQTLEHFSAMEGEVMPDSSWDRFESEDDVLEYAKRRFFQKMTSLWPREN